jgi:flagellum-specific peptidoglycan hydrolase FlgJ
MAEPLGNVVFKVPELGKVERQLRERQEVKDQRQQQMRSREVDSTGAERLYSKNAFKLKAGYGEPADAAFNEFRKAGIEYEQTGSSKAKADYENWSRKLNQIVSVGVNASEEMVGEYKGFYAKEGEGYAVNSEWVDANFDASMNKKVPFKVQNGTILLQSGEGYVSFEQHTMFSDKVNQDNSFLIPREAKTGKYVVPTSFITDSQNIGVLTRSTNVNDAIDKYNKQIDFKIKSDKDFLEDVAVYYEISNGHIQGTEPISRKQVSEAMLKIQEPEELQNAINVYKQAVGERVNGVYSDYISQDPYAAFMSDSEESNVGTGEENTNPQIETQPIEITPENILEQERRIDMDGALNQAPVSMNKNFSMDQSTIQGFIDKYSDNKSPVTAQDVMDVSAKYGVPVEFILAQGRLESNFGTKGRGARTKNIYNVGNVTAGDTMAKDSTEQKKYSKDMGDWVNGLESYADLMARKYRPSDGDWNKLLEEFVNNDGNRYAADANYEKTLSSIISSIYDMGSKNSVSSQEPKGPVMTDEQYQNWLQSKGLK